MICALAGCASKPMPTTELASQTQMDNAIDIALYKKAVRENPNNPDYLVGLAERYISTSDWSLAAAAFREALLIHPSQERAILGYGYASVALGYYKDAIQMVSPMTGQRNNVKADLIVGIALDGIGETQKARQIYTRLIEKNPRDLAARTNLALSLAFEGNQEAHDIMHQVAWSPDAQMRHKRNLVLVCALLGETRFARKEGRALKIDPAIVDQIIELANDAKQQGIGAVGVANAKNL